MNIFRETHLEEIIILRVSVGFFSLLLKKSSVPPLGFLCVKGLCHPEKKSSSIHNWGVTHKNKNGSKVLNLEPFQNPSSLCSKDRQDGHMATSALNVMCAVYNLAVILLGPEFKAGACIYLHYTTLRSGSVLYIVFRATIMVSVGPGSCRAVIFSLESSLGCIFTGCRKRLNRNVYIWNTLSPTARNKVPTSLVYSSCKYKWSKCWKMLKSNSF